MHTTISTHSRISPGNIGACTSTLCNIKPISFSLSYVEKCVQLKNDIHIVNKFQCYHVPHKRRCFDGGGGDDSQQLCCGICKRLRMWLNSIQMHIAKERAGARPWRWLLSQPPSHIRYRRRTGRVITVVVADKCMARALILHSIRIHTAATMILFLYM